MDDKLGKILIVDDDENINELIDMYLKSSGYETKKCFNGLDACNIVTNDNIGLVILDIMIPGKDGVEVLKFIRKQSNVPVIMLTAKGEVFDKVLALELGADDEQLDFPIIYASAREGFARFNVEDTNEDMEPLFKTIVDHVEPPKGEIDGPFQMLVTTLDSSEYVGKIAIGKIHRGTVKKNQSVALVRWD